MAKRSSKRTGRKAATRKARTDSTQQPTLPNIVAGAIEVGTQMGRAALRTARDLLAAAGRLTGNPELGGIAVKAIEPSVVRDALPEAKLNAIAQAGRQKRTRPTARRIPATRKPLSRTPARTDQPMAKTERRKAR